MHSELCVHLQWGHPSGEAFLPVLGRLQCGQFFLFPSGVFTYATDLRKIATLYLLSLMFVLECPLHFSPSNQILPVFKTFILTKFHILKSCKHRTKNFHIFFTQTLTFYHICFIFLSLVYFFFWPAWEKIAKMMPFYCWTLHSVFFCEDIPLHGHSTMIKIRELT